MYSRLRRFNECHDYYTFFSFGWLPLFTGIKCPNLGLIKTLDTSLFMCIVIEAILGDIYIEEKCYNSKNGVKLRYDVRTNGFELVGAVNVASHGNYVKCVIATCALLSINKKFAVVSSYSPHSNVGASS